MDSFFIGIIRNRNSRDFARVCYDINDLTMGSTVGTGIFLTKTMLHTKWGLYGTNRSNVGSHMRLVRVLYASGVYLL